MPHKKKKKKSYAKLNFETKWMMWFFFVASTAAASVIKKYAGGFSNAREYIFFERLVVQLKGKYVYDKKKKSLLN